jgi:hypothetical protein
MYVAEPRRRQVSERNDRPPINNENAIGKDSSNVLDGRASRQASIFLRTGQYVQLH